ncbi:MAG: phosphoribosylformylglycinamidine synthase subunit PurQ [Bdellovibrionales bacterium]|nr:phosphoribosylformylglycinamidine synthase subunit PurQ [Bdellovibrionales bacterium]
MKVLVLTGDGINCERETARAFELAGGEAEILHVNDLFGSPARLLDYAALALPGGFSFGDDLGSGQVLALKLEVILGDHLRKFVQDGRPVLGICNGFQALVKLGLLPEPFAPRTMALARNRQGHFQNRWVGIEVDANSRCMWIRGLAEEKELTFPIRHGEGRVVFLSSEEEAIHRRLAAAGQIPLRYAEDVNGSHGRIAGVCDPSGLVFGLMPHPEAAVSLLQHPMSPRFADRTAAGPGLRVFRNCVEYLRKG